MFNHGQSFGKKLINIRVVKVDGSTPSIGSYLLRWLLFPIDGPITSGLGLLVVLLNKNNQRLGDLAAGTMVIKEKNYRKIPCQPGWIRLSDPKLSSGISPVGWFISRTSECNYPDFGIQRKRPARRITGTCQKSTGITFRYSPWGYQEKFLQNDTSRLQYYALEEI